MTDQCARQDPFALPGSNMSLRMGHVEARATAKAS